MFYLTVKQSPAYHQMTLEELLFGSEDVPILLNQNTANTRTYEMNYVGERLRKQIDVGSLISKLRAFNANTEQLRSVPRKSLYREFHIPKRSGGLRKIDAPKDELMNALRQLKTILEDDFGLLYHTSAFAYVKHRCAVDAVKRHQSNQSRWFGKYDLSNFFGSTTLDFVMRMFGMIFPLCAVMETDEGREELRKALELAFLDGGLPQGTPISPLITNVMMIPIDFKLFNSFRNFNNQNFVYTRYADDFLVSSRYDFDFKKVEQHIVSVLKDFGAPFVIKAEKTRYGSSAGRNWNLGVMLNADNKITVGHRKKKQFQAMVSAYTMDRKNGKSWDKNEIQVMQGLYSYYLSVEGDVISGIMDHLSHKSGVDILAAIKEDLRY